MKIPPKYHLCWPNYFMNALYLLELLNCWLYNYGCDWNSHFCTCLSCGPSKNITFCYVWRFYYSWVLLSVPLYSKFTVGLMYMCKRNFFSFHIIMFKGKYFRNHVFCGPWISSAELSFLGWFWYAWREICLSFGCLHPIHSGALFVLSCFVVMSESFLRNFLQYTELLVK